MAEDGPEAQENELVEEEEVTAVPGWAPSVSLDLQEVPTGEEDEDEIYSQRSKLYRFKDGEWKERGLGDSKLLRHRGTGKIRYMMRQERTGKIVANHYIYAFPPYCDLKPNQGSDKCWVWTMMDYSEDEAQVEQFALRFKEVELAQQFQEAFNNAKEHNAKVCQVQEVTGSEPKPAKEPVQPQDSVIEPKQGSEPADEASQPVANPFAGMSLFGASAPTGGSPSGATGGLFSSLATSGATGGLLASSGSLFGDLSSSSGSAFAGAATGGLFSASSGSMFGDSSSSSGSLFGGGLFGSSTGGSLFGQSTQADASKEEEAEELVPEEEVTVVPGWAPTVSLELQEVPTGEEEEEEIYSQRSKLYRFKDGEWKERGLGDSKLLRHRGTGKIRYMMRQEKTGKIVANHYIYAFPPYCDLKPNQGSDKCWVWTTMDYSEDEAQVEQFALKFKEVELAQQFQEVFNNAKEHNAKVCQVQEVTGSEPKPAKEPVQPQDSAPDLRPSSASSTAPAASTGGLFGSATGGSSGGLFGGSSGGLFGGGLFGGASSGGGLFSGISFGEAKADSPQSASQPAEPFSGLSFASGGLLGAGASTGSGLFGACGWSAGGILGGSSGSLPAGGATGGLWGATTTSTANGAQEDDYVPEEEVTQIPGWAPSVSLEVRDYVETGEECEEELYSQRSKLLRFIDGEWKERGTGDAKILRHVDTGRCRFLMRQEKTSKIVANHYIIDQKPYCELVHNAGNAKIWVWTAIDYADEEQKVEQFALRFKTEEIAEEFGAAFLAAKRGESAPVNGWQKDEEEWVQAEYDTGTADGETGCFAALAQQQAESGWRCMGCRLVYGDQVIECSICETARPGYEEEVAAAKADKSKGMQSAAAAFLGGGTSTKESTAAAPSAPALSFGFGSSSSGGLFGATPASSSIFGGASAGSIFGSSDPPGAGGAPSSSMFGSGGGSFGFGVSGNAQQADGVTAETAVGIKFGHSLAPPTSPPVQSKAAAPPPPPATVDPSQVPCGAYNYPFPCGQQFGLPPCMPHMGMAGMMGMPAMYGYGADYSKVDALERSVKDLQDKMKELKDAFDTERQERSKVELTVQFLEKRLQEEESKSSRAEARVTAAEAQVRQLEGVVEGLRRSMDRPSPLDDSRLLGGLQKSLEEQLAPLRQGLEQKASASDESLRLLGKVLEQSRDAESTMKQRLEAVEARLDRMGHEPAFMPMTRPPLDRVAYFQSLHVQQTGRRLANGCEDEPQPTNIYLADPKPLLRRIP
ncbi:unnamed protein product [Durusdinium trenchii]|uniref:RanBD1 domain-containing protein n=1 Tax=Durusdinium trenchii TaxID=1381693 RepID=A0ABP0NR11_9DINO